VREIGERDAIYISIYITKRPPPGLASGPLLRLGFLLYRPCRGARWLCNRAHGTNTPVPALRSRADLAFRPIDLAPAVGSDGFSWAWAFFVVDAVTVVWLKDTTLQAQDGTETDRKTRSFFFTPFSKRKEERRVRCRAEAGVLSCSHGVRRRRVSCAGKQQQQQQDDLRLHCKPATACFGSRSFRCKLQFG
jgi:hypothetical protein